ncbi:MAG: DCC1-like thiol-disulfide oxidoreductase family protein [Pseudomonadota bacterium]
MPDTEPMLVVYDGECPFCTAYVRMLRLREAAGPVELIDARSAHPVVAMLRERGYDLDEGMALVRHASAAEPDIAHGDDCIHQLALMTTPSGLFNRLNAAVFSSQATSKLLYPVMRRGRNLALGLLGRRRIADDGLGPTGG